MLILVMWATNTVAAGLALPGTGSRTGTSDRQTMCSGPLCHLKGRPSNFNQQCTYAARKACCAILSKASGGPCRVSQHGKTRVMEVPSSTAVSLVQGMRTSNVDEPAQAQAVPPTPLRQNFMRMLSPLHVKKLQDNEFEYNKAGQIEVS